MRKAFLAYLVGEGMIPPEKLDAVQTMLRSVPEPIGSIAFGFGLITGTDVDVILDEQRRAHRPFGEIAAGMGLLTRAQIDTLLMIQQLRAAAETAEALALSGVCPVEEVMPRLGRFLTRTANWALCSPS
jgi:hypothetical protein